MKYFIYFILICCGVSHADDVYTYTVKSARFSDGSTLSGQWSYNKTQNSIIASNFTTTAGAVISANSWSGSGVVNVSATAIIPAGDINFSLGKYLSIQFEPNSGRLDTVSQTGWGTAIWNSARTSYVKLVDAGSYTFARNCLASSATLTYESVKSSIVNCAGYQVNTYRGLRPSDPNGFSYLSNPERGWRYENMVSLRSNLANPFDKENTSQAGDVLSNAYQQRYNGEKYQIVQQYVYLDQYTYKPLDAVALSALQQVFDQAKKANVKLLLRFVYKYDNGIPEPAVSQVTQHMQQLRDIILNNVGVVYAFQFGWVGVWGELHDTIYTADQKRDIYLSFLNVMPANRKITIRTKENRDMIVSLYPQFQSVVGFNNDFYTLEDHIYALGNDYTYNGPDYKDAAKWGSSSIVDVEMPYDDLSQPESAWVLNHVPKSFGWGTIWRFSKLAVSTFSITHNTNISIAALRSWPVYSWQFSADGLVGDPDYFLNNDSNVSRTAFDYIRDHLGYRLQLTEGTFPNSLLLGQQATFTFRLVNVGFSKPINNRPIYVALLDANNQVVWSRFAQSNSSSWLPGNPASIVSMNQVINIPKGNYKVALFLPDESASLANLSSYAIKLANGGSNFSWQETAENRFNIVGNITIQ